MNGNAPDEISGRLASVIHGEPVILPSERKEGAVPVSTLARYAGVYQIAPKFALTIALQGDHLTAQGTNQPSAPIFASSPTRFFSRVVDAEIEFFAGPSGKVDHLILHQGGHESKDVKQ